jgi:PPOX class probable F420-dependent enzyme
MTDQIPEAAFPMLDGAEYATVATIEPSGQPHLSVVWVSRDGNDVLFSTVEGRRKATNLERDPRCTLLVFPLANPYSYLEIRGSVAISREGGRELIDDLHEKYRGTRPYPHDGEGDVRVVLRLTPSKVIFRG